MTWKCSALVEYGQDGGCGLDDISFEARYRILGIEVWCCEHKSCDERSYPGFVPRIREALGSLDGVRHRTSEAGSWLENYRTFVFSCFFLRVSILLSVCGCNFLLFYRNASQNEAKSLDSGATGR